MRTAHDKLAGLRYSGSMATLSLSKNHTAILGVLQNAGKPLSAYEILAQLHASGIKSPPVVYRALKALETKGLIHRIESQNAYIACHSDHPHQRANVLMICDACGNVEEAPGAEVQATLAETARRKGFHSTHQTIELHGHCGHCS